MTFQTTDRSRQRRSPRLALTLGAFAFIGVVGISGTAEAIKDDEPIDVGSDPTELPGPPPGGEGIPCLDPRLPCRPGPEGPGGPGGTVAG